MNRLQNKVALITGGNSGIGRAVAQLFTQEGAKVVIAARDTAKGEQTAGRLLASGGEAVFVQCDVRRPDDCTRVVEETLRIFSRIDILFNNAGIVPLGTVLETSLEDWDNVLATNVSGVFYMSRAVLPHMIKQSQGVIINNGSDWSLVGGQAAAAYCATKGAVALLTKAMALDHARQGIRVNAICPGDTYVERWDSHIRQGQTREEYLADVGQGFPLGRVGTVEEIAKAVLFLACDDSSYMTGQLLVVDGGNTAGGTAAKY
jgi:meso-butanediol dehydrogenase / (S,S)-butanediol dehydrogenase / diacetyl reductase